MTARIKDVGSGKVFSLESYAVLGRGPECSIRVDNELVSNGHVSLCWSVDHWFARDLGSTNGSWINGEPMPIRTDVRLAVGDRLAFGDRNVQWELVAADAPSPMVTPAGGGEGRHIDDGIIEIPRTGAVTASIFRGRDGDWVLEAGERVGPILPGSSFEVDGTVWRFSCPQAWKPTSRAPAPRLVEESQLRFQVSSNEEQVVLVVEAGDEEILMGQSIAYYMLLTLARLRERQTTRENRHDPGWIHRDELARMLRCGEQQLNLWVHRIRTKFCISGFLDYAAVIERRDGTGQLRIGTDRTVIQEL